MLRQDPVPAIMAEQQQYPGYGPRRRRVEAMDHRTVELHGLQWLWPPPGHPSGSGGAGQHPVTHNSSSRIQAAYGPPRELCQDPVSITAMACHRIAAANASGHWGPATTT